MRVTVPVILPLREGCGRTTGDAAPAGLPHVCHIRHARRAAGSVEGQGADVRRALSSTRSPEGDPVDGPGSGGFASHPPAPNRPRIAGTPAGVSAAGRGDCRHGFRGWGNCEGDFFAGGLEALSGDLSEGVSGQWVRELSLDVRGWGYPPLSCRTSPPQGGRSAEWLAARTTESSKRFLRLRRSWGGKPAQQCGLPSVGRLPPQGRGAGGRSTGSWILGSSPGMTESVELRVPQETPLSATVFMLG
ncbi:hypothetical protein SAMN05880590_10133 [Rhizobium sp. RU35A]|nr:hypothetical protein SAMN05880590_10133 [Rhizobium sp. RU35A]